ncbi:MAG TPA: RNA 2',3'-cyclic phosphodiesterase [Kofleriaceae bacterium]|nr:RNA 2',3'-cyclic phosphodiesterase [Kofleriaceae bacterium]
MGNDGQRLFIGARVSMTTVAELAGTAEMLARRASQANLRVKWVAPASYHVTLKFIGWVRRDAAEAIGDAMMRAAREPPFAFKTQRLGAFPTAEKATVVWAGIEDKSGGLARLASAIDRELSDVGIAREKRAFHAHVTLGRLRDPADVSQVILPFAEQVFSETRLTEVVLFESRTKSAGSEYSKIVSAPLFRAENAEKHQTHPVEPTPFDASDDGWDRDSERRH